GNAEGNGQRPAAGRQGGPRPRVPGLLERHDRHGGRRRHRGRVRGGLRRDVVRLVRARARGRGPRIGGREVPGGGAGPRAPAGPEQARVLPERRRDHDAPLQQRQARGFGGRVPEVRGVLAGLWRAGRHKGGVPHGGGPQGGGPGVLLRAVRPGPGRGRGADEGGTAEGAEDRPGLPLHLPELLRTGRAGLGGVL
ncbi:MAG: hypothetical protein AVDCRST_MAG05-4023, partial [uncultured Rubrobacteraceae bacterium]